MNLIQGKVQGTSENVVEVVDFDVSTCRFTVKDIMEGKDLPVMRHTGKQSPEMMRVVDGRLVSTSIYERVIADRASLSSNDPVAEKQ